jgi:hypothetical protein
VSAEEDKGQFSENPLVFGENQEILKTAPFQNYLPILQPSQD